MPYGEAVRLVEVLKSDPSSMLFAALARWDYPASREAVVLMDLFDLQHRSKSTKPQQVKPYPRPWPLEGRRRFGKTRMSREQMREVLNRHGHSL